jgi:hypothetical protein
MAVPSLAVGQVDIAKLILQQIFQIAPTTITKYASTQNQLLYLLLIPHVILILFLYIFADSVARMGRTGGTHKGLFYLVGIVSYLYLVLGGWYGSILVPIFIGLWQLIIALALFAFVFSRFIHPARAGEMLALGKAIGGKLVEKERTKKRIEAEIKATDRMLREVERSPAESKQAMSYKSMQLSQLRMKKAELEAALEELEGG